MTATASRPVAAPGPGDGMSHREVLEALSGVLLVSLGVILTAAAVAVERRAREPLVTLRLFDERTVVLTDIARERATTHDQGATP
jgi:hypothetical protein